MNKQYLKKRHNVWWLRIRIPAKAKEIMGKTELWKNLKTSDLAEANRKKHKEIGLMHEEIAQSLRDEEGKVDKISKEVQIIKYAEYLREATVSVGDRDYDGEKDYSDDCSIILGQLLEGELCDIYGSEEAEAILYSHNPQYEGKEPDKLAEKYFFV